MTNHSEVRAYLMQQPLVNKVRISKRGECFTRNGCYWFFAGMVENLQDEVDQRKADDAALAQYAAQSNRTEYDFRQA